MGKKQAARKRKWRPPETPGSFSSESGFSLQETPGTASAAVTEPMTSPKKPAPFQRVWSEENEITLLNSLVQFEQRKKGTDRSVYSQKEQNDFIVESLGGQFTGAQVSDKLRRLKRKFLLRSDGQPSSSSFPNRHERRIFEVSAKIWGHSGAATAHPENCPKSPSDSPPVDADTVSKVQTDATAEDFDVRSDEQVRNSDLKEDRMRDSSLKDDRVWNSDLDFGKFDVGAVSDLLGKAVEYMGRVGMDKELKKLKKEIKVAELELFLKKGELLKRQLTRVLESSGT